MGAACGGLSQRVPQPPAYTLLTLRDPEHQLDFGVIVDEASKLSAFPSPQSRPPQRPLSKESGGDATSWWTRDSDVAEQAGRVLLDAAEVDSFSRSAMQYSVRGSAAGSARLGSTLRVLLPLPP